ncbi:TonB-dependent receptor [Reichenbachiella agariperforans]|uniref:TonB-dependent receptor n=1 Tax=Reichenbachiella agariperforans TaxID=156994 RepID=UPI001C0815DF|nr:TonB-dependent receptor plug domain-containing protein [Reichenbachiella agariperforans]MBU2915948.1 TonB-dependent receptor plug domain-containing protein [Reichenbachiella agariperforans]
MSKLSLFFFAFVLLFSSQSMMGQTILNGRVVDDEGIAIPDVLISTNTQSTVSDDDGFFVLSISNDSLLTITHVNYESKYIVARKRKETIVVELKLKSRQLEEVSIVDESKVASDRVDLHEISRMNVLFGESDVIKYLVTLPGIASINSFDAGISVRGGSTTENAFLVKGMRIADPTHITSLVTAFDPYVLSRSTVYKSGFPSMYNGRLSGYVDMNSETIEIEEVEAELSVGIISSSAKVAIPIGKGGNNQIKFSARQTYLHLISTMYNRKSKTGTLPKYGFQDYSLSYHGRISDKWSLSAFGLVSGDELPFELTQNDNQHMQWNAQSAVVSLDRKLKRNGSLKILGGVNGNESVFEQDSNDQYISSEANNQSVSVRWDQPLTQTFAYHMGYSYERNDYSLSKNERDESISNNSMQSLYGDLIVFPNLNWVLTGGINMTYYEGLRSFYDVSPRVKVEYLLDDLELWVDYARTRQYEEKLPFFAIRSPMDIPVPLGDNNQSARCDAVSLGAKYELLEGLKLTSSVFFKRLDYIKDFSASSRSNLEFEYIEMVEGQGHAYGVEAELVWTHQKLSAGVNYTYLESKRQFDEINEGDVFSPPFDITSSAGVSLSYALNRHWFMSAFWTYTSGIYVTVPEGVAVAKDITNPGTTVNYVPIYGDRYNYRLPARHRLDLGISYRRPVKNKHAIKFSGGTYNTYNHKNVDFIYLEAEQTSTYLVSFVPKSRMVLPFVPYLTITFYLNEKGGQNG